MEYNDHTAKFLYLLDKRSYINYIYSILSYLVDVGCIFNNANIVTEK